jgi:hypothetical protein
MAGRGYIHNHHHLLRAPVVVQDNDILCGRGVNIAQHPGNERFRTLVQARADDNYCESYSASEKKSVAEGIIEHLNKLDPPGRFLRRDGSGKKLRGLAGPWEVLNERDAIKKTCQALRDCNRSDRTGYAAAVETPEDVIEATTKRKASGLTNKQMAAARVAASQAAAQAGANEAHEMWAAKVRAGQAGDLALGHESAALLGLKKRRTEDGSVSAGAHDLLHSHHINPSVDHYPQIPSHDNPHVAHTSTAAINGEAGAPWTGHHSQEAIPPTAQDYLPGEGGNEEGGEDEESGDNSQHHVNLAL